MYGAEDGTTAHVSEDVIATIMKLFVKVFGDASLDLDPGPGLGEMVKQALAAPAWAAPPQSNAAAICSAPMPSLATRRSW